MRYVKAILIVLFVLAVPAFLITTTARVVIQSDQLYSYGFDAYEIPLYTGVQMEELMSASKQIRDYFNNDEEYLNVRVRVGGIVRGLYNQREIPHMRDVKSLVQGVYNLQIVTGLYILAYAVLMVALNRRRVSAGMAGLATYAGLGGAVTLALVVVIGLISLVGFDQLFLVFHQLSFANDLWQLDPSRDYLIAMFPQGFFFDATMAIAAGVVIEAAVFTVIGVFAFRRLQEMDRKRLAVERAVVLEVPVWVDLDAQRDEVNRLVDGHRV